MPRQTALMISVVNKEDALAALEGGAEIIDIKNPAEGALGAPSPAVIRDVCTALQGKKPFSVALGEFPGKPGAAALAALGCTFFQPDYVKIAFIPHHTPKEIRETLQKVRNGLLVGGQKPISLVSVAYADTLRYASWDLDDFAAVSEEGGANGCLVDTWEKKGKSLLDYWPAEKLARWIAGCRRRQLFCGLAGSLRFSDVAALLPLEPDLIGVRTAVCDGNRLQGRVSARKVGELRQLVAGNPGK